MLIGSENGSNGTGDDANERKLSSSSYDILKPLNSRLNPESEEVSSQYSDIYISPPSSRDVTNNVLSRSLSEADKDDKNSTREFSRDTYLSPSSFYLSLDKMKSTKFMFPNEISASTSKNENAVALLDDGIDSKSNYVLPPMLKRDNELEETINESDLNTTDDLVVENTSESTLRESVWEPVHLIRQNVSNQKCYYCGKEEPEIYIVPRLIVICESCSNSFCATVIRRIEHIMNMDVVNLLILLGNSFIPNLPIPNINLNEELFKSICNDDLAQTHRLLLAGANPSLSFGSLNALALASIVDHSLQRSLLILHGFVERTISCDKIDEELRSNSPRVNHGSLLKNVLSLSKGNKVRYVINLKEFVAVYTYLEPLQVKSSSKPQLSLYTGEKQHIFHFSDVKQYFRWLKGIILNANVHVLGKLSTLSVLHGHLWMSDVVNKEPEKVILAVHKPSELLIFSLSYMKKHGNLLRLDLRKLVSSTNRHLKVLHDYLNNFLNTPKPNELYTQLLTTEDVPVIINACLKYIFMNGLLADGIYRVSGSESQVRAILSIANPYNIHFVCVHDAATVLRRFLRGLSEPILFPILRHRNEEAPFNVLSKVAHATVQKLFFNLRTIVEFSDRNRMTSNSLAVIFTPCLLGSENVPPSSVAFIRDMIENCENYFDGLEKELHLAKLAIKLMEKPDFPTPMPLLVPVFFMKRNEEVALNVPADLSVSAIISRILSAFSIHDSWLWSLFEVFVSMERPLAPYDKVDITRKCDFCVKPNYLLPNPLDNISLFQSIEVNGKMKNMAVKQATLIISEELTWRLEDIELYIDLCNENTLICVHSSKQTRAMRFSSRELMISWYWILLSPQCIDAFYRDGPRVPPVVPKQLSHLKN